jgi:DNA-binding response OmpR family regulator/signal transduction histidine kinase
MKEKKACHWERVGRRMNSDAGEYVQKRQTGWWIEEKTTSPNTMPDSTTLIPTSFTHEYHVLAEVCSSISSGFMLLNAQERMMYANPSVLRLLRLQKRDLSSEENFDIRRHLLGMAAEPQRAQSELERIWSYPEQEYSADLALLDAATRWLRIHSFPVRDPHGNLLGRGLLFDDISLERTAIVARGETLALAANELKTPLAIIKGCATTLLGSSARWDSAMYREMLQMIDTQSDRLYDVLNTLLDVWRFDAGTQQLHLAQVYIPELLQQVIRRWQRQAPERRFILSMTPTLSTLVCDAQRIEQVLNHLLNNAIQYSGNNKIITVQADANEIEVRISVNDEGIGIASEYLDLIFDRFYRIQQQEEKEIGSGLGLAAARATIEAHGGKIWADSQGRGRGSTFYVTLPFSLHVTSGAAGPIETELMPATRTLPQKQALLKSDRRVRVLLAEKDPRLTRYLRANLEEQQYRVQIVSHGIQFLRQLDLEEPDIILLSTQLADMSGIELLQRLREFSQAPVVMLCDDCDEDGRVQLFDLGGDDLVMKPFGMKELLARVRALLRRQITPAEQSVAQSIFVSGDLVIDYAQHQVSVEGKVVQLSRTEYKLLSTLAQNVGMVVTHELLLEKVWGPEYNRDIDFIWVYISRLRRKVESDSRRPKYILTVEGVGYRLAKL